MERKHRDYEVLGLEPGATRAEVRAAYLRLAKKHHPDKNPGDKASEWIFKEVGRAYESLREKGAHQEHGVPAQRERAEQARRERERREREQRARETARREQANRERERHERERRERAERTRRDQAQAEQHERESRAQEQARIARERWERSEAEPATQAARERAREKRWLVAAIAIFAIMWVGMFLVGSPVESPPRVGSNAPDNPASVGDPAQPDLAADQTTVGSSVESQSLPLRRCRDWDGTAAMVTALGYNPEEVYAFGLKIQDAVRERDLAAFFSLVDGELSHGPRRKYAEGKTFSEIFPDSWRTEILNTEPPRCGGRGHLGNGSLFFQAWHGSPFSILQVSDWVPEEFPPVPTGWTINGHLLSSECLVTMWLSSDNYELFQDEFSTGDDLFSSPGEYFGDPIYPFDPIYKDSPWPSENRLWAHVNECIPAPGTVRTGSSRIVSYSPLLNYRILAEVSTTLCQHLAPNLPGECLESYLVDITECTGGSMGCLDHNNIYGMFEMDDGERIIFPLKNFDSENLARNFLDEQQSSNSG